MEVTRTFDLLDLYSEKYQKEDALAVKRNKTWEKFSSDDYIRMSYDLAYGLLELGFKKGDKIASITNNRPEWNISDMAMAMTGIIHIPVFPTLNDEDHKYILEHSEVTGLFISDKSIYQKLKDIISSIPAIRFVYSFNEVEGVNRWKEILTIGHANREKFREVLERTKSGIRPEDMFTIVYTSGTTGSPKGVMLSHRNMVSNFIETSKIQPLNKDHKIISFLPLCHIYERSVNYHYQYLGISIYYAENMGTILDDIREIKADGFNTVPRLFEKVYDKIMTLGKSLTGIRKKIFFGAVGLGMQYDPDTCNRLWYKTRLKIADMLVFHKWREALGGNVKLIVSGGSALQPRLAKIFWAAGVQILEGYGLTETSPVISVNHPVKGMLRFGTVGLVLEGVQVKIADDGEILCKGPNLMIGYYKDPEYTAQVIDNEGWFHTGDIGIFEDGKFLKITDRKKEIFKTTSGKYVAPQVIENKLKESIFIEQAIVVGENEKFVSIIISPNFNYLHNWCAERNILYRDNCNMVVQGPVLAEIQKEIYTLNKQLALHEQVKRFRIVCDEWTPLTGELSPSMKLKRSNIHKKYRHLIADMYSRQNDQDVIDETITKARQNNRKNDTAF
ncbi:MAG: AMP-dependent synthetase/ligase [Bacteroidia bacterium]|nr:AMP-dependent synthetase/ligase [Bacteroidia bacterium]